MRFFFPVIQSLHAAAASGRAACSERRRRVPSPPPARYQRIRLPALVPGHPSVNRNPAGKLPSLRRGRDTAPYQEIGSLIASFRRSEVETVAANNSGVSSNSARFAQGDNRKP